MAEWIPLRSSNVDAYMYDDDTLDLSVRFKSGAEYTYHAVPRYVADGLGSAPSPGKYLNDQIKGVYETERMD